MVWYIIRVCMHVSMYVCTTVLLLCLFYFSSFLCGFYMRLLDSLIFTSSTSMSTALASISMTPFTFPVFS